MRGPPTASTRLLPAASGRTRIASSIATFEKSIWRMIGCVRSQSMMIGFSNRPSTSMGTSDAMVLTSTKRPFPIRCGVVLSSTTTSKPAIPPWYPSGWRTSSVTCGSVLSTFSRNRLPGLTRSTEMARGGGSTAYATLSDSRSSETFSFARTTPPPGSENGTTTARRTAGSSVRVFSARFSPSRVSVYVNVCGSVEKLATERNACVL